MLIVSRTTEYRPQRLILASTSYAGSGLLKVGGLVNPSHKTMTRLSPVIFSTRRRAYAILKDYRQSITGDTIQALVLVNSWDEEMKVQQLSAGAAHSSLVSSSIPQQPPSAGMELTSVSGDSSSTPEFTPATSGPPILTNPATPSGVASTRFYSESQFLVDSNGPSEWLALPAAASSSAEPFGNPILTQPTQALATFKAPAKARIVVWNKRPQGASPGGFGRHTNEWLGININITATSSNLARLVVDSVAEQVKKSRKED